MSRAAVLSVLVLALMLPGAAGAEPPRFAGRTVRDWMADLDDANVLVRLEAIEVLGDAGAVAKEAVPRLEKIAQSEPLRVRVPAALALHRITGRPGPAVAALVESLRDDSAPSAQARALARLLLLGDAAVPAAPGILDLVDHSDAPLRKRALAVLACMGRPVLPAVLERFADPQPRRRRQAATAVLRLGPVLREADVESLLPRLKDDDAAVRLCCARALWGIGSASRPVVAVLLEAVRSGSTAQRHAVIETAGMAKDRDQREAAHTILDVALRGKDPVLRVRAAAELYRIDRDADAVLPIFIAALKSHDPWLREQAVSALEQLGPRAAPALPVLMGLLRSREAYEADFVNLFKNIGPAAIPDMVRWMQESRRQNHLSENVLEFLNLFADDAATQMLPLLKHRRESICAAACSVLGLAASQARKVVPALIECLGDDSSAVQSAALRALSQLGPAAREAVPRIRERMKTGDVYFQAGALAALEEIGGDPEVLAKLALDALNTGPDHLHYAALGLLWSLDPPHLERVPRAKAFLRSNENVLLVRAMVDCKGPDAASLTPVIVEKLSKEKDPEIRIRLIESIGTIGPGAREAAPALRRELEHGTPTSRVDAAVALQRIGQGDPRLIGPALVRSLREGVDGFRFVAAMKLLREQGPAAADAVPFLLGLLGERNGISAELIAIITRALIRISPKEGRAAAIRLLEKRLDEPDSETRAVFLLILDPAHHGAITTLRRVLQEVDSEEPTLSRALEALAEAGPAAKDALGEVRMLMHSPDAAIRARAAVTAWQLGDSAEPAIRILVEDLGKEQCRQTRLVGAEGLTMMGPAAEGALPTLLACRTDPDRELRAAIEKAIHAVKKLDRP
jgi:HEAT repeat protein